MDGYSIEQRRTFGRIQAYLGAKGITDKTWQDVAIDEDGTFIEWPAFFPQDEGPSDVEGLIEDDDEAEEAAEETGLETVLGRNKTWEHVLLRCLLEELLPTRRRAVIRKVRQALKNGRSGQ